MFIPASIRIIKIVRDKNPISGEEEEAYTAEIECEAEDAKNLASELARCPYGKEIMDLLKRANFIPIEENMTSEQLKAKAEQEEKERLEYETRLKEDAQKEILRIIYNYLTEQKEFKKFFEELNFDKFCELLVKKKSEDEEPITRLRGLNNG